MVNKYLILNKIKHTFDDESLILCSKHMQGGRKQNVKLANLLCVWCACGVSYVRDVCVLRKLLVGVSDEW